MLYLILMLPMLPLLFMLSLLPLLFILPMLPSLLILPVIPLLPMLPSLHMLPMLFFNHVSIVTHVTSDHNTLDEEVDSEMEDLHDHSLAAGVIECKRKHHEIYQTIAEMIRCAGDLVAESLIRGQLVRKTDIFGLGLNYDTQTTKLIDLSIDFDKDSGTTLVSDKVLPLHPAMCWLLDCIVV